MADKTIDLTKTIGELTEADPGLVGALAELGLEDLPGDVTLIALCQENDIDLALVSMALEAGGYEVVGYEPTPQAGSTGAELLEALARLFSDDDDGAPTAAVASVDPMVAHIEAAVRRAEREGRLPRTQ